MAEGDLSPTSDLRRGMEQEIAQHWNWYGGEIKGQRSAEPQVAIPAEPCLRQAVFSLSRKPHHIILPSSTFTSIQQLLGPFARLC